MESGFSAAAVDGDAHRKSTKVATPENFRRKISIYPETQSERTVLWRMFSMAKDFMEEGSSKREEKAVFAQLEGMGERDVYRLMTSSSNLEEPVLSCTGGLHSTTTVFAQIFLHWWNENAVFALQGKEEMKRRGAVLLDRLMLFFDRAGLSAAEQLEILNTEMTLRLRGHGPDSGNFEKWTLRGTKTLLELMTPPGTVQSKENVDINWPQLADALRVHQERLLARMRRRE